MHELAVCQSLINQVETIAKERQAQCVDAIHVAIGPLSGIESHLLKTAFSIASAGTVSERAELIIEELPVQVECSQCHTKSIVPVNKLVCKQCGDWRTTLISGDEMLLMRVELEQSVDMNQRDAAVMH